MAGDEKLHIIINNNICLRLLSMSFTRLKANKNEMWHAMCNTLIKKEMKNPNKF